MEPWLKERFVSEMVLDGHLSLQTTLWIAREPPEHIQGMYIFITRPCRPGESRSKHGRLIELNKNACTVSELCEAFWRLFPSGLDLEMLTMVVRRRDYTTFGIAYDRLLSQGRVTARDKYQLFRESQMHLNLKVSLELISDPEVQCQANKGDYQSVVAAYVGKEGVDPSFLARLMSQAVNLGHDIDSGSYVHNLLLRGNQEAALVAWNFYQQEGFDWLDASLLQQAAIGNGCFDFALTMVDEVRKKSNYDWSHTLVPSKIVFALSFVESLAEIDGCLEREYRQLLAREVRQHLFGTGVLRRLLELAAQYKYQIPYESFLAWRICDEYVIILWQDMLVRNEGQSILSAWGRDKLRQHVHNSNSVVMKEYFQSILD